MSSLEDRKNINSKIIELIKELEASEGAQIKSRIRRLGMCYFIFMGNYAELKNALDNFRKPVVALQLWMEGNDQELTAYQHNTVRLLHNFLASAKTLVDHMRDIVNEIFENNPQFLEEYQNKINEEFASSSLVQIVHKLRNYILHKGLKAFTKATFRFTTPPDWSMMIDITELLKWEKWSQKDRAYLNTLGDEIRMDDLVNPYADIVSRFHSWFDERQYELNQEAYKKTAEIHQRIANLTRPVGSEVTSTEETDKD